MNSVKVDMERARKIRVQAELLNREADAKNSIDVDTLSKLGIKTLIHELQVYQIELELQNDELQNIQDELLASQAKYFRLYNLAPIGYITLDDKGDIIEANLTFCNLLGYTRQHLIGKPLTQFIISEDQDTYYMHNKQLQKCDSKQSCELHLVTGTKKQFLARIDATCEEDECSKEVVIHCAITDISEHKHT